MNFYKIFYILLSGFVFCFKTAYASKYCEVLSGTSDYVVTIPPLNISAAAEQFSVLADSGNISKKIRCSNVPSNIVKIRAIVNTVPYKDKTEYTINSNSLNLGSTIDGNDDCPILKTENSGIGVVWFNYNSLSRKWFCATQAQSWGRNLQVNGTADINDRVYFLKIGPIEPGVFSYSTNVFSFDEYVGTSMSQTTAQMTNNGLLYTISFQSEGTQIDSPVCSVYSSLENSYLVNTRESLNPSKEFSERIEFSCTGYIEQGDAVNFKLANPNSLLSNGYYATSINGLYVSITYSENMEDSNLTTILKDGIIKAKTNDNLGNGYFYLHFTPMVVHNENGFPIEEKANVNVRINRT